MDDYTKRKNTESEENYTLYAGLGSEVFIIPREHFLNESDGSIKDGWEKNAVCLDVSGKRMLLRVVPCLRMTEPLHSR